MSEWEVFAPEALYDKLQRKADHQTYLATLEYLAELLTGGPPRERVAVPGCTDTYHTVLPLSPTGVTIKMIYAVHPSPRWIVIRSLSTA